MKKFNSILVAAMGMAALTVSCKQEGLEPVAPEEGQTIKVEVSLGETLKGTFTDREGLRWEVGDQLRCFYNNAGEPVVSEQLKSTDISPDGSVASFKFHSSVISQDRMVAFVSPNNHPSVGYPKEVEFTLGNADKSSFTQENAGELNKRRLFLHSGLSLIPVKEGVEPKVKMDICGSIFRILPYTSTYSNEKVLSVTLSSKTNIVGTVEYDRANGTYKNVSEKNYASKNSTTVQLTNPLSLEGVKSAETSKGLYLPIPASGSAAYDGYKYEVRTDKAIYTFDAMDKKLTVSENAIKNVYLNLDKATKRTAEEGFIKYIGEFYGLLIGKDEVKNKDLGWWKALVSSDGKDPWTDRLNAENAAFYKPVFTCIDKATGEPATWISVRYFEGGDYCHWHADVEKNVGEQRSAEITATFSDVGNYKVMDGFKTKTITVTQESAATKDRVTIGSCSVGSDYSYDGEGFTKKDIGYSRLDLNGISQAQYGEGTVYAKTHFVVVDETAHAVKDYSKTNVDWASCEFANNGTVMTDCVWWLSLNANMTGKTRVAYVALVFANDGEYDYPAEPKVVKITQTSSLNATASFVNASSEKVSKDGGVVKTTLSLTIDGTAQADVAKAIDDYGLKLETSSAVESRTIAANGEVTLNVKANATSAERKITLTLKHNNTVLATTEFTQEAGEGGAVTHTYNYTIINHVPNGSKNVGFGKEAGPKDDLYRIENVTIDGKKYNPGDDLKNLVNDTELINALVSHIFSFGEITNSDVQVPGIDPLTTDPESFVELVPRAEGAAIYFKLVFKNENTTGARRTIKIITRDGEGNVTSTIVYFQNA